MPWLQSKKELIRRLNEDAECVYILVFQLSCIPGSRDMYEYEGSYTYFHTGTGITAPSPTPPSLFNNFTFLKYISIHFQKEDPCQSVSIPGFPF